MSDNLSPFEEPADEREDAHDDVRADAHADMWADERARTHEDRQVHRDAWQDTDVRAREDVRRRRHERDRVRANPGAWIGGAIMIMLGVGLLLRNLGIDVPFFRNWWAIFILIPAVSSLTRVWNEAQTHGRLSSSTTGELIWGLVLVMVALTFLFGLAWSLVLPILLILAGLSFLITAIAANR
jgi:hypothetical protein